MNHSATYKNDYVKNESFLAEFLAFKDSDNKRESTEDVLKP